MHVKPLPNRRVQKAVKPDERKPSLSGPARIANLPLDGKISNSTDLLRWLLSKEQSSCDIALDFVVATELEKQLANFDFGDIKEQLS